MLLLAVMQVTDQSAEHAKMQSPAPSVLIRTTACATTTDCHKVLAHLLCLQLHTCTLPDSYHKPKHTARSHSFWLQICGPAFSSLECLDDVGVLEVDGVNVCSQRCLGKLL